MKIKAAEEKKIREAGKQLNGRIEEYVRKYAISDKQDLLAMVAFDCIIENLSQAESKDDSPMLHAIENMILLIDKKIIGGSEPAL